MAREIEYSDEALEAAARYQPRHAAPPNRSQQIGITVLVIAVCGWLGIALVGLWDVLT